MSNRQTRRSFIVKSAVTTAGVAASAAILPFSDVLASEYSRKPGKDKYPISFFTKLLDKYEPEFMAETLSMAGVDGFDLTVRPKGSVLPENVARDLPKLIEAGKKYNIRTEMMVSGITDTTEPHTEEVLRVAAANGVKHYRLAYYNYDYKIGIWESLQKIKESIERLAKLNQELGIQAGIQNHEGIGVGAPVWDIWELIRDLPPELISCQYDNRHAAIEGARSWTTTMRLMSKNIGSLAIKDFHRTIIDGKEGKPGYEPLGEGLSDFDTYFKLVKELNIDVPISLHIEYPMLTEEEEKLPLLKKQKILVSVIKHDVDFIRANLVKYELV